MSYHSRSLVLRVYPVGEEDTLLDILTKDYGRLRVLLRAGTGRSKLSPLSVPYGVFNGVFVLGKAGWRFTTGELEHNLFYDAVTIQAKAALRRVVDVLAQVVSEEGALDWFDELTLKLKELIQEADLVLLENKELLLLAFVFKKLGYLEQEYDAESKVLNSNQRSELRKIILESHTAALT